MHKKLMIFSAIMALLQIVVGGLMVGQILNTYTHAQYIGIIWVSVGVCILFLTTLTFLKMKLSSIDKLFIFLTISLIGMLATCWVNPLISIAIIIYIPVAFTYLTGLAIRSRI